MVVSGPSGAGKSMLGALLRKSHRTIEVDVLTTMQRNGVLAEWPAVASIVTGDAVGGLTAAYLEVLEEPTLLVQVLDEVIATGHARGELDVYLVPDVLADALRHGLRRAGYVVWSCSS